MRILAFFQSLRGKLILTYTTVTVLALLALELTLLLVALAFSRGLNSDTLAYLSDVVSVLPRKLACIFSPARSTGTGCRPGCKPPTTPATPACRRRAFWTARQPRSSRATRCT